MRLERMFINTEVRSAGEAENPRAVGLGIVYDQWTDIMPGYRERILQGAAKPAPGVIKSFFNHDPSQVLSTTASTPPLVLRETPRGIEYESPIPPTSYGKDLVTNLERKNVQGSSFSFSVPKGGDRYWEDENGVLHREITELVYYEIGPVTDPAYAMTTASIRSAREELVSNWRASQKSQEEPELKKPEEPKEPEAGASDAQRFIRHGELKATL